MATKKKATKKVSIPAAELRRLRKVEAKAEAYENLALWFTTEVRRMVEALDKAGPDVEAYAGNWGNIGRVPHAVEALKEFSASFNQVLKA